MVEAITAYLGIEAATLFVIYISTFGVLFIVGETIAEKFDVIEEFIFGLVCLVILVSILLITLDLFGYIP